MSSNFTQSTTCSTHGFDASDESGMSSPLESESEQASPKSRMISSAKGRETAKMLPNAPILLQEEDSTIGAKGKVSTGDDVYNFTFNQG